MEMKDKLIEAFGGLLNSAIALAPKLVVGLLLIVAGLIFAKLLEIGLRALLQRVHFDGLVGKAGVDGILQRMGIRQELSLILPRFLYFLTLVVLAQTMAEAFGLTAISGAIAAFFAYLPNIFAALLLLIGGSGLGKFLGDMVASSAESSGVDIAPSLGRFVSGGIFFVCAMMAIAQLKIDTGIVRIVSPSTGSKYSKSRPGPRGYV